MLGWVIVIGMLVSVTLAPYLLLKQDYVPIRKRYLTYRKYDWTTRRYDVIQRIEIK